MEVRSQKSEVRSRKSEVGSQKSDARLARVSKRVPFTSTIWIMFFRIKIKTACVLPPRISALSRKGRLRLETSQKSVFPERVRIKVK